MAGTNETYRYLTVTWLIEQSGSPMMPAYYQIGAAILSLILVGSTAVAWRGIDQRR